MYSSYPSFVGNKMNYCIFPCFIFLQLIYTQSQHRSYMILGQKLKCKFFTSHPQSYICSIHILQICSHLQLSIAAFATVPISIDIFTLIQTSSVGISQKARKTKQDKTLRKRCFNQDSFSFASQLTCADSSLWVYVGKQIRELIQI